MLFSKIAARQVSLRALRAAPQASTVSTINQHSRPFQSGQPSYNTAENRDNHKKTRSSAYNDEVCTLSVSLGILCHYLYANFSSFDYSTTSSTTTRK